MWIHRFQRLCGFTTCYLRMCVGLEDRPFIVQWQHVISHSNVHKALMLGNSAANGVLYRYGQHRVNTGISMTVTGMTPIIHQPTDAHILCDNKYFRNRSETSKRTTYKNTQKHVSLYTCTVALTYTDRQRNTQTLGTEAANVQKKNPNKETSCFLEHNTTQPSVLRATSRTRTQIHTHAENQFVVHHCVCFSLILINVPACVCVSRDATGL